MNTKTIFFITIFIFFCCYSSVFAKVNEHKLPSGIKILTSVNNLSETSSVNVWVKTGSANETADNSGISHFLEHMFFRGTDKIGGLEFKSAIERLGGSSNAETSKDYTRYYINVPAENTKEALMLLVETLKHASFTKDDTETERKVILEEYRMNKNNPMNDLFDKIFETAYPNHPYARAVIGTEKNIKKFTTGDLKNYRREFYSPSNLTFIINGSFDEKDIVKYITDEFSNYDSLSQGTVKYKFEYPKTKPIRKNIKNYGNPSLILAFYGPPAHDEKELVKADLFCFVMGMGKSSILEKMKEENSKKINSVDIQFQTMKYPGLILIASEYDKKAKPTEIEEILMNTIKNVAEGKFTEAELKRGKKILTNNHIFSNETNAGLAGSLGIYAVLNRWQFSEEYCDMINNLTKKDIMDFAKSISESPDFVFNLGNEKKGDKN